MYCICRFGYWVKYVNTYHIRWQAITWSFNQKESNLYVKLTRGKRKFPFKIQMCKYHMKQLLVPPLTGYIKVRF